MGNGGWGMGNREWAIGNGGWGTGNREWDRRVSGVEPGVEISAGRLIGKRKEKVYFYPAIT